MKKILIIRFSAIGDVALWVPVVKRALALNPAIQITFLTKKNTTFLFENTERLQVIGADLKQEFKGLFGIIKLAKWINAQATYDTIIDGHDVIRTKILLKLINAKQKFTFSKGRKEKQLFINKKINYTLPHTTERYSKVLLNAGLKMDNHFIYPAISINQKDGEIAKKFIALISTKPIIAIAPFAQHKGKIFPYPKMEQVIEQLTANGYAIILFGAGKQEIEIMENWLAKFSNIYLSNQLSFAQQIGVMQHCKCMLSMDSANMHIAAMQGIKVVSIWGATHTSLGFAPMNNQIQNCIEISQLELPCRPCSVFGNKPCALSKTPYACLQNIAITNVGNKIME